LLRDEDRESLADEFCNDVFSATARQLRNAPAEARSADDDGAEPPWPLLAPFGEGAQLPLGWSVESLSTIRAGAATLVLAHAEHGAARIAVRRNGGAPMGVAHTDVLDFMLLNGGSGGTRTEESVGRVLIALARALVAEPAAPDVARFLAALRPHAEVQTSQAPRKDDGEPGRRVVPRIDLAARTIEFAIDEAGVGRLALYDAVLRLADRCFVLLTRPAAQSIGLRMRPRDDLGPDALKALAADVTRALNRVVRGGGV